jgi:type III secretory pathway component EscV
MDNLTAIARMKVFLSYSSADDDVARRLATDLQSANIDVWLDQWELGIGDEFVQNIEHGVDEAEFVIVLLTRTSVASEWVNREWRRKVHMEAQSERIAVVPVRGETCEIPDFLAQRSHADISAGSYRLGFKHLLEILRHYSKNAAIKFPEAATEEEFDPNMLPVVLPIALEVSQDLIPFFEPDNKGFSYFLDELAPKLRDALQAEFGFPFPGINVRGNETDMPPGTALILIDEVPETLLNVDPGDVFVDGTVERLAELGIKAEARGQSISGRAHSRIAAADRAGAEAAGLATRDAAEHITLALQAVIRKLAPLFLDIDTTRRLVENFEHIEPGLAGKTVPKAVSWFELTDVLRYLVAEELFIGDMGCILRALSQNKPEEHDTARLAERVRQAMSHQITAKFTQDRDSLLVLRLDPEIEVNMSRAILRTSAGSYLDLDPQFTQNLLSAIREQMNALDSRKAWILILTVVEIRRYIRRMVELEFPLLQVVSHQDLEPGVKIQTVAWIRLGGNSQKPTTPDREHSP